MKKKFVIVALTLVAASLSFGGCSSQNSDKATVETTATVTEKSTTIEPTTNKPTLTEPTTSEIDSKPAPNTSEMVDYIAHKAKADATTATINDIDEAVQWLKNNVDNIFDNNENMENTMYYGELLEYKYQGTDDPYEKVGWQAFKTVKYVYRGYEAINDTATQDNFDELKEILKTI